MSESGVTGKRVGIDAPPEGSAAGGAPLRPAARRRLSKALVVAALSMATGAALAQPFLAGRMSPDERERFRRELRQQPERGRPGDDPALRRESMSPRERDQLRQQLREVRPDERRSRGRRRD